MFFVHITSPLIVYVQPSITILVSSSQLLRTPLRCPILHTEPRTFIALHKLLCFSFLPSSYAITFDSHNFRRFLRGFFRVLSVSPHAVMLTSGRRPQSRVISSTSPPTFRSSENPQDVRYLGAADLPPRLPYPPHHPPLVRRVAAAAAAAAAAAQTSSEPRWSPSTSGTNPYRSQSRHYSTDYHNSNHSSSISTSRSSSSPPPSSSTTTATTISTQSRPRRRPRLLVRHRAHSISPPPYLHTSFQHNRHVVWPDLSPHRMPVMFDERADWETPYDPSSHGGGSARRRLHSHRSRVSRLGHFLAWRVRRGTLPDQVENDSLGLSYEELLQLDDGNVKCGLSNDELAQLNHFKATKDYVCRDCHICLDEVNLGADIVKLCCDHVFHKSCIHTWLKMKRTCPICRCEL